MIEPIYVQSGSQSPRAETACLSMGDRAEHIDRCFQLLANRRRRFCLYHLHRATAPIAIHDLAELVGRSITPTRAPLTERVLEDAVLQFYHAHLPKLWGAGLVRVNDGYVWHAADPAIPIQDWVTATAEVELDSGPAQEWRSERVLDADPNTGPDSTSDTDGVTFVGGM